MSALAKLIGLRWADHRSAMFRWGEVSTGWGLAFALCKFEEHWSIHLHLIYVNIFISLWRPKVEPKEIMESWGLSIPFDPGYGMFAAVHLNWGDKCKIVHMPWAWEFYRHSVLGEDGRHWIHELAQFRVPRDSVPIGYPPKSDKWFFFSQDVPHWSKELPYRYVLRDGTVQERTATISVSEMEWRWRWFMWLAWPRKVRRSIEVAFSDEVGERTGSWKGGCTGCGYEMRRGAFRDETPGECLQRMEQERKFA